MNSPKKAIALVLVFGLATTDICPFNPSARSPVQGSKMLAAATGQRADGLSLFASQALAERVSLIRPPVLKAIGLFIADCCSRMNRRLLTPKTVPSGINLTGLSAEDLERLPWQRERSNLSVVTAREVNGHPLAKPIVLAKKVPKIDGDKDLYGFHKHLIASLLDDYFRDASGARPVQDYQKSHIPVPVGFGTDTFYYVHVPGTNQIPAFSFPSFLLRESRQASAAFGRAGINLQMDVSMGPKSRWSRFSLSEDGRPGRLFMHNVIRDSAPWSILPTDQWKRVDFTGQSFAIANPNQFFRFLQSEHEQLLASLGPWKLRLLELAFEGLPDRHGDPFSQEFLDLVTRYQQDLVNQWSAGQPHSPSDRGGGAENSSASRSTGQPESSLLPEVAMEETPLWELLSVFGLHDPDHIVGADTIDTRAPSAGLIVKKIRLTTSVDDPIHAEGVSALRQYVGKTDTFELLYREDRLVAIVPISLALISSDQVSYLDLSAYSAKVPRIGEGGSQAVWGALASRQRRDQQLIRDYLKATFPAIRYHSLQTNEGSYVYVRVDRATGERTLKAFHPGERFNPFVKYKSDPNVHQAVIPLFPTVYSPALPKNKEADDTYYQALYPGHEMQGSRDDEVKLKLGHSALVVGSGCGIEPWLVSLITGQKVYALDVNPFAIANTRTTAKILNVDVEARVHDNIADARGTPAFPGMRFDRVFWAMPAYQMAHARHSRVLSLGAFIRRQWDGDVNGTILMRFAQWLPQVLAEDGLALIWNQAFFVSRGRVDMVKQILFAGGVEVRAWYHPLAKFYASAAAVYILRRPRATTVAA
jgi:hypothetical protein